MKLLEIGLFKRAKGSRSAEQVRTAWKNSPEGRERIAQGEAEITFAKKSIPIYKIDSCEDGSADETCKLSWRELMSSRHNELIWSQIEDSDLLNSDELGELEAVFNESWLKKNLKIKSGS